MCLQVISFSQRRKDSPWWKDSPSINGIRKTRASWKKKKKKNKKRNLCEFKMLFRNKGNIDIFWDERKLRESILANCSKINAKINFYERITNKKGRISGIQKREKEIVSI